jgi:hypothetical protein
MKKCKICNIIKNYELFGSEKKSKDGKRSVCKECRKIESKTRYKENKEYFLNYNKTNKDKINEIKKIWSQNNKELKKEIQKKYLLNNKEKRKESVGKYYFNNIDKIKKYKEDWNEKNIGYQTNYDKKRKKTDPIYKITKLSRTRIYLFLKQKNINKNNTTFGFIGCKPSELKEYLENQFKDDMSWDNYGKWHIDHIIPLSSAKTNEEVYKLCHYKNLQPLWAEENLKKGSKII